MVVGVKGRRWLRWAAGLVVAVLVGYPAVMWIRYERGSTISYSGYDGPVMVSRDGRTVTVGGFPYMCGGGTESLVADETSAQVELRLRFVIPNRRDMCTADMAINWALSTRLNAPLGSRALINPDTSQALAWFDGGKTLQPTKLPAGYSLAFVSPALPPLPNHLIGCWQSFDNGPAGGGISIIQEMGVVQPPFMLASDKTTAILVRGRQGVVDQTSIASANENRISWYEDGQTMTVSAYPANILTVQDLVAMVDSAPRSTTAEPDGARYQ